MVSLTFLGQRFRLPRAFGQNYSLCARSLDPTIHCTLATRLWDIQRSTVNGRHVAEVAIFNLSVGLMSTGLSPGDTWRSFPDPP